VICGSRLQINCTTVGPNRDLPGNGQCSLIPRQTNVERVKRCCRGNYLLGQGTKTAGWKKSWYLPSSSKNAGRRNLNIKTILRLVQKEPRRFPHESACGNFTRLRRIYHYCVSSHTSQGQFHPSDTRRANHVCVVYVHSIPHVSLVFFLLLHVFSTD